MPKNQKVYIIEILYDDVNGIDDYIDSLDQDINCKSVINFSGLDEWLFKETVSGKIFKCIQDNFNSMIIDNPVSRRGDGLSNAICLIQTDRFENIAKVIDNAFGRDILKNVRD